MRGSRGGGGGGGGGTGGLDPSHLKNYQNKGFLSNTGPDPIKITKLSSLHSMLGRHRHASETPFKWRFGGGLIMASIVVFGSYHPSSTKKNSEWDPL